jgi:imidazolonepropionase-like amidohydrolase
MTPSEASDLGQESIEHLEFLPKPCTVLFDPEARGARRVPAECEPAALRATFHRFAANGTWLDPTIGSFRYFAPQQWAAIFAEFCNLAKQIRQSGVHILAGTDQSSFLEEKGAAPGRSLHEELAILVEAGFTPAQVLRAATSDAAVFLGLADQLGTIEAGKTANLVLTEGDPLRDINNTSRIAGVVLEGRLFDRKALDR